MSYRKYIKLLYTIYSGGLGFRDFYILCYIILLFLINVNYFYDKKILTLLDWKKSFILMTLQFSNWKR